MAETDVFALALMICAVAALSPTVALVVLARTDGNTVFAAITGLGVTVASLGRLAVLGLATGLTDALVLASTLAVFVFVRLLVGVLA
jgi:hypothetical protein